MSPLVTEGDTLFQKVSHFKNTKISRNLIFFTKGDTFNVNGQLSFLLRLNENYIDFFLF